MKTIQQAFKEAMETIAKDLGLKSEDLNLWVKCKDGVTNLMARKEETTIKPVTMQDLIGKKMKQLKITTDRLDSFFQSIHAAFVRAGNLPDPDAVSLVLYFSRAAKEICIGFYQGKKPKKSYRFTDLMDKSGMGSGKLN